MVKFCEVVEDVVKVLLVGVNVAAKGVGGGVVAVLLFCVRVEVSSQYCVCLSVVVVYDEVVDGVIDVVSSFPCVVGVDVNVNDDK